jgi:hypothetical protein
VIDESGFLLGMRIPPQSDDQELAEGLRVDVLQRVFDIMGLSYDSSDSKITLLGTAIFDAQEVLEQDSYTKSTRQVLEDALEEAESVYEDVKSTDSDYQEQVDQLSAAVNQLRPMKDIYLLIMIILGAVIFVILLIILVVCIRIRKQKRKPHYHEEEKNGKKRKAKKQKKGKGNLGSLDNDATVAMSNKLPTAYLIHKNSGTRTLIAKNYFVLGSKAEGTDYCVSGNRAVSRKHAAIVNENGIFFLQDLESTNHSFINGAQLSPGERNVLRNQDQIRLASEEFVFELK